MEKINFREKLDELMKRKEISIAKLARRADLSYGTVYYFLKGRSEMTADNLAKLFNILGEIK